MPKSLTDAMLSRFRKAGAVSQRSLNTVAIYGIVYRFRRGIWHRAR